MDEFLDRYKKPKLNEDQVNHLNNPITPKEKEEDTRKRSRWQEIIKLRAEIDQIETKEPFKDSTKPRAGSLRKLTRLIKT